MGKQHAGGKKSALKKLRGTLSSAGLIGPQSQVSKKAKKRGTTKTNNKHEERKRKLSAIQSALNPFEMKINRTKLDVLGLKRKDTHVNVAVARQRAVERRKATLGAERKQRNRVGGIVDRRIGEGDAAMDPEEKMLLRFTLERQQQQRKARNSAIFNLEEDDDVEGEITKLTHFGQSLDDMDDFEGGGLDNDEDAEGGIDQDTVAAGHFGGFEEEDGPARKKTKAEVMQELIAKSKMHKHERQMAKQQDEDAMRELDDDFSNIRALLFAGADEKPMLKAADAGDDSVNSSYDAHVREMVFERRARPQNRLKTEEEVAREELAKLERAERHRRRRMDGLPSDSEPESSDDELTSYATKKSRAPQADDLGDDFMAAASDSSDTELTGSRSALRADSARIGVGLGAEVEDSESEDDSSSDSSDSSDEGSDLSDSDADSDEAEHRAAKKDRKTTKADRALSSAQEAAKSTSTSTNEVPFTFTAPTDYDSWLAIVDGFSLEQQLAVVRRLRTQYHIRLAPQNKAVLATLCTILLEHLAVLAEQNPPVPLAIIDDVVRNVGELAAVDPERVGEHCRQLIIEFNERITRAVRLSNETHNLHSPVAPTSGMRASDLALMRVFVALFSASDRYHSLVTPMLMSVCHFLAQFLFTSLSDIAAALVLLGIIHEAQRLSRRFVPEAINFLFMALSAVVCDPSNPAEWPGQFPLSKRQREALAFLRINEPLASDVSAEPIRWSWLVADDEIPATLESRLGILRACLALAQKYTDCYFSTPAFIEIFTPLLRILQLIRERLTVLPDELSSQLESQIADLKVQLDQSRSSRRPLALQQHKPVAIQTIAPKFETNYNLDAHYDPNHDRNEILKLRRQVNKEKRGAMRELRRDAQFVSAERLREQKEKDAQYAAKMKKAWGVLENDQSEMKKLDKLRIKERKAKIE